MAPTVPKLELEDALIPRIHRIPKSLTLIHHPQIPSPLETLSQNLTDERRRLRHFITCFSGDHPSLTSSSALSLTSTLSNANKRMKPTFCSSDLRRVASVDPGDVLLIRDTHTHLVGNPLHSSVDAKLQAICQTLESSRKKKVSIESKPEPVVSSPTVETEESYSSYSVVTGTTSFSVLEIEILDFNEVPWDDADDFVLRKYPTYEID
ncbi:uncharacterized protein A4U43_C05F10130 [Asparagus officinalis]|uniref:Uncharacterized protein n=1 Tax=Asparagus officinalis TaxID=4686 RepID=A0A5P1EUB5_ASPOF|nr:uncharacterized protein A4U43_C05F10130 [Asparagus officinalis]